MPSVDSLEPAGSHYAELITLLRALSASDLAVGVKVTIFDPDLDPDGDLAHELARVAAEGWPNQTASSTDK